MAISSTMISVCLLLATLLLPAGDGAAQSSVRVKFVSPPLSYAHGLDIPRPGQPTATTRQTTGRRLTPVSSIGDVSARHVARRPLRSRSARTYVTLVASDPESMWPTGVFLPPEGDIAQFILSGHLFTDIDIDADPFLVTGSEAASAVKLLLTHGELFYGEFPHAAALLRHQDQRRANGLAGNRLGSNRPESPFYRWMTMRRRMLLPSTGY